MGNEPQMPGRYWARSIVLDITGRRVLSLPYQVDVVASVPNARGHKMLVKTGLDAPKYRGFACYEWGAPTPEERARLAAFANQVAVDG